MKLAALLLTATLAVLSTFRLEGQTPAINEELSKAQALVQQGNISEASKAYTDIMEKYPDNREAVLGWVRINATGEEDARKKLEELQKSYPKNTAILFFIAFWQAEYNHLEEALATTEKLITLQPDSAVNWLLKGQILEPLNRLDEAMIAYDKATTLDPENSDAWQNRAGLLAKKNKLDEAIDSYTKAIQLTPDVGYFYYNRGCAYCRNGDQMKALADLSKAISMDPRLKSNAPKDEDFKSLWDNEEFKKLTTQ